LNLTSLIKRCKKELESYLDIAKKYLEGLSILAAFITSIYGLVKIRQLGKYSIFILLTTSALIQTFYSSYFILVLGREKSLNIVALSINIYLLVELIVISYFFYENIKNPKIKKTILLFNGSLSILLLIILIIKKDFITIHYSLIAAYEAIMILINCIFIFVQILEDDSNDSLRNSPDFIITAGIFFFFSITCPVFILNTYFRNIYFIYDKIGIINNLGYLVLFLTILIAFQCKIRLKKS